MYCGVREGLEWGCEQRCSELAAGSLESAGELHLEAVFWNVSDFLSAVVPLAANVACLGKCCEVVSSLLFAVRFSRCRSTDLPLLCTFLWRT